MSSPIFLDLMTYCSMFVYLSLIDCGTLPNPDNGGVSYSNGVTTYQEVATFTCDAGYILTGVVTRTCLASGNWDGSSPVCVIKGNTFAVLNKCCRS